jgi:hypothetical protein
MLGFRVEFSPLSRLGQWYSSDMNKHPEIDSVILEHHLRQTTYSCVLINSDFLYHFSSPTPSLHEYQATII